MEFTNFTSFIEHYKDDAIATDIKKLYPLVYHIYTMLRLKLEAAEFDSEIEEVKNKSEAGVKEMKGKLQRCIINKEYKAKNTLHLFDLKVYLLYKDLYNEAKSRTEATGKIQVEEILSNKDAGNIQEEISQHSHIFNGNGFKVWECLFDDFAITESSRTDVKFIFEEMKYKGMIHETVNQTSFLSWIFKTYQIDIQKTSNHSKTGRRIAAFRKAEQLYKT